MTNAEPPRVPAGTPRRHEAPGRLMGMAPAHRMASPRTAPSHSEAAGSQPATSSSTAHAPVTPRARNASPQAASPHSHGQPPRTPHPVSPWERRLAHGRSSARAAKTFTTGTGRPSENSGASAFRFLPCAAAFPQAPSAPQGAPRGRAPTRGGRQPWERASTRGRTRPSART